MFNITPAPNNNASLCYESFHIQNLLNNSLSVEILLPKVSPNFSLGRKKGWLSDEAKEITLNVLMKLFRHRDRRKRLERIYAS